MTKLAELFRKIFTRPALATTGKQPPVRCEYCGQAGHTLAECPNAAKFHAFSVDHDAEEAEWENNANSS